MKITKYLTIAFGITILMGPSLLFAQGFGHETEGESDGKSYFALGLHIDYGPGNYGTEITEHKFVKLTHYKLLMLRDAVEAAVDDIDDDSDSDVRKMRKEVESAIDKLLSGDYKKSLDKVEDFLDKLKDVDFYTTDDGELDSEFNRHGELLSRGKNIVYTLREKIIPFAS